MNPWTVEHVGDPLDTLISMPEMVKSTQEDEKQMKNG